MILLVGLALALMFFDHRGQHLSKIRAGLIVLTYPIQAVAALPAELFGGIGSFFTSKSNLKKDYETLQSQQLELMSQLQQLQSLEEENERLRTMLGSRKRVRGKVLAAELLAVTAEPSTRKILLGRGSTHDVYIGQPVIDAFGIMGQITEVAPHTSRATLITDPSHAIPVLVSRSGLRAIVEGTGQQNELRIPFLTAGSDIREGDTLVTSGMGGTFPPRYPVAVVERIINDPNEAFLSISAKPAAHLNHSKQVLLLWHKNQQGNQAASETKP